jgi:thymidylate synthase ThyX
MYSAKIICDSISETGKRITTFEITFPRIVLAEFNTHRMFSRNSASSRAIPFKKQIERVETSPFVPEVFPINGKGMQPNAYLKREDFGFHKAEEAWYHARDSAIKAARILYNCLDDREADKILEDFLGDKSEYAEVNIHKQLVNRLLEPFQWHTVIVTATEWDNFFKLRTNEQAQYEIRRIADLMYDAYHLYVDTDEKGLRSRTHLEPKLLKQGEWHLPFISDEDEKEVAWFLRNKNIKLYGITPEQTILNIFKEVSVARCARVSYLTHDGKRDIEKDLELFDKLKTSGHWSPFEHVATPYFTKNSPDDKWFYSDNGYRITDDEKYIDIIKGNFIGWKQYRKEFQDENCTHFRKA